jgi:hypothetical protein
MRWMRFGMSWLLDTVRVRRMVAVAPSGVAQVVPVAPKETIEAEEQLRKSPAGTRGLCSVNLPATEPRLEGWVVIGASALDLGDKLQWRRDSFQEIFRVDRIVSPERQS